MLTNTIHPLVKLRSKLRKDRPNFRDFRPRIVFAQTHGRYLLKTVTTPEELEKALRLRHQVFQEECLGQPNLSGLDFDRYDLLCDHLALIDQESKQWIGTYRVNCTLFGDDFYTASEFNIDALLALDGVKIELGRACIAKEFRSGMVIHLLWRGIAQYIKMTSADYLFGCSSIFEAGPLQCAAIYKYLRDKGHTTASELTRPIGRYFDPRIREFMDFLDNPQYKFDATPIRSELPSLFRSYLKLGARVCGEPAYDPDFLCYDFVTLQEVKSFSGTVERKYGL